MQFNLIQTLETLLQSAHIKSESAISNFKKDLSKFLDSPAFKTQEQILLVNTLPFKAKLTMIFFFFEKRRVKEEIDKLIQKNVEIIQVQLLDIFNCAMKIVDSNYCFFCFQNL